MVDDAAVYLLGNAVVITAVAGLHMKDRNAAPRRHDRRQATVRVAEDQNPVGRFRRETLVDLATRSARPAHRMTLTEFRDECRASGPQGRE